MIFVLGSSLIFNPTYSFAQNEDDNPLSPLFEVFRQLFSFSSESSSPVQEFGNAAVIQTSGTSSTTDTSENNIPPIANAGSNQTVMEFANVILNGTSSTDTDGFIVSYNWIQTLGKNVTLSQSSSSVASFVAPSVNGTEIFEFQLTVMDNSNATDTDFVAVTVNQKDDGPTENIPPTADAGPDQIVMEFATVTLNGTSSTDTDGEIVSYNWSQLSGPSNVTISNSNSSIASFNAPDVDGQGIFEFLLAIVDNSNATDTDTIKITVNEKDNDDPPVDDNVPPIDDTPRGGGSNEKDGQNKITLCHIPPGNPENAHTITVGESAVIAHIAHGDKLGECSDEDNPSNSENSNQSEKSNSGKGNNNQDNSGKGNSNQSEKSNSGKGKNDK